MLFKRKPVAAPQPLTIADKAAGVVASLKSQAEDLRSSADRELMSFRMIIDRLQLNNKQAAENKAIAALQIEQLKELISDYDSVQASNDKIIAEVSKFLP